MLKEIKDHLEPVIFQVKLLLGLMNGTRIRILMERLLLREECGKRMIRVIT